MMKTTHAKQEDVIRDWYLVDAENKILGRLACEIAHRLRGKHKPIFAPYMDTGDFVIVVNAEKIALTGKKLTDKVGWDQGRDGGEAAQGETGRGAADGGKGDAPKEYAGKGHAEKAQDLCRWRPSA
jgi:ribosomal protein L13